VSAGEPIPPTQALCRCSLTRRWRAGVFPSISIGLAPDMRCVAKLLPVGCQQTALPERIAGKNERRAYFAFVWTQHQVCCYAGAALIMPVSYAVSYGDGSRRESAGWGGTTWDKISLS
jgi:hypothetical protein